MKMKYLKIYFIIFNFIVLILLNLYCTRKNVVKGKFPAYSQATLDFNPKGYTARVAFPDPLTGKGRIWLKGSSDFETAELYSGPTKIKVIKLLPPYYSTIELCEQNILTARFISRKEPGKLNEVKLYPKDKTWLENESTPFSIIVYGCFQPFTIKKEKNNEVGSLPEASSFSGKNNMLMRELFGIVGKNEKTGYFQQKRYKDANGKINFSTGPQVNSKLISEPRLIIGTGDQIYTDGAYEGYNASKGGNHPISGWDFKRHPKPNDKVKSIEDFKGFLHSTYLNFYSFNDLEKTHLQLPALNVWDDHEIRDGWGSHGDEYKRINGRIQLSSSLGPYFQASQEAFIAHQFSLGPSQTLQPELITPSLHQVFEVGGKKGFAFDLRSQRNIKENIVIGPDQLAAFKSWCNGLQGNEEVIIVSSIPLFFDYNNTSKTFSEIIYGIKDDLNDSWNSKPNKHQRNIIVEELITLRNEERAKPIILSGDVHLGCLSEIWYTPFINGKSNSEFAKVLCYQLISSGLSHETLSKKLNSRQSTLKFKSQAERKGELDFQILTKKNEAFLIDPQIKKSAQDLNFGAVEFKNDTTKIHLFFHERSNQGISAFWQNIMFTEWNKTWKDEEFWQSPIGRNAYRPSMVNEIHWLHEMK